MPRRLMWVEYGDDAELSRSHKKEGDFSALTRDADGNLSHATLSDADEFDLGPVADWTHTPDESTTEQRTWSEEDVESLALLISAVVLAARPHVERWWKERALPAIKATNKAVRKRFTRSRRSDQALSPTEQVPSTDLAPGEARLTISTDEAEQRLLAALVARAFSDEQLRVLLNARIEGPDGQMGFTNLLQQFTPDQVETHVAMLLEANPRFLDDFIGLCKGRPVNELASIPRD
jgi:hypothetical protein